MSKSEDTILVTPVKTFTHMKAGTLLAGKDYSLAAAIANRLLAAGHVNPSTGDVYSTKVLRDTPVTGNANPSQAAGEGNQSSASQAAQVSTKTIVNKSGNGGSKKVPNKRGR